MKGKRAWLVLPPVAALLVNLLPLVGFFNSDDFSLLKAVRDNGAFGIWSGHGEPFFRPLVSASIWIDSQIWGLDPFGFHLTNVLLHAANALLVTVLVGQILRRARLEMPAAPLFAGVLFAVLPCHAEAVAWVSGRTDVLSTAFALGAAVAFLSEHRSRLVLSAGLFGLALGSKESPLLLPVLLLLAVGLSIPNSPGRRKDLYACAGLMGLVPIYLAVRFVTIGQFFGGYGAGSYLSGGLSGIAKNAAVYAGKAIAPGSMQMLSITSPAGALGFAAFVALGLGVGVLMAVRTGASEETRSRAKLVVLGVVGFFVLVLPALPLGMNTYTAEGSRFLYLPSVGLCLALGVGLAAISPVWIARTAAAALVLGYGYALCMQNAIWVKAGEDAQRSIRALRDLPANTPLLTVPDSYRGAYVLRNGLSQALALFGSARSDLAVYSTYSYEKADFTPDMRGQDDLVEILVPGNLGSLLSIGQDAHRGAPDSPMMKFSPAWIVLRSPKGMALTPDGLLLPSR